MSAPPGQGWLPFRVRDAGGESLLDWVNFGARRLTDPFFEDSVARVRSRDPTAIVTTRLFELPDAADQPAGLEPTGLIFHMSRCGSTLLSQMLAASSANIVVSEASPIDAVVRLDASDDVRATLLRAVAAALGRIRNPGETRYFLKLDSWHACALPLFRRAFPRTPWVFLYRDPAAVLVSHARRTGLQMVADLVPPAFYGIDPAARPWGEDYWAQVLAAICGAAVREYPAGGGVLVDYAELPDAGWMRILPHFSVTPAPPEVAAMAAAARFDAKSPGAPFTPDAASKRQARTAAIERAAKERLAELYVELGALRARPAPPARSS